MTVASEEPLEISDEVFAIAAAGITSPMQDDHLILGDDDLTDVSDDAIDYGDDDEDYDDDDQDSDGTGEDDTDDADKESDGSASSKETEEPSGNESKDALVTRLEKRGVSADQINTARSLGLTDKEIRKAGSVKALNAITGVLLRQVHAAGKASEQEAPDKPGDSAPATTTKPTESVKADDDGTTKTPSDTPGLHRFDLEKMNRDDYDDEAWQAFESNNRLVDHVEAMNKKIESLVSSGGQQSTTQNVQDQTDAFDRAFDELNFPILGTRFKDGKSSQLSDVEFKNRAQLAQDFFAVRDGYEKMGLTPPDPMTMLKQAAAVAFGDKIVTQAVEKDRTERTQRLTKQAARRRPAGSRVGSTKNTRVAPDSAEAIASDPNLKKLWSRLTENN